MMHIHYVCHSNVLESINFDTYDMPIACYKNSKLGAPHAPTPNHYLEHPELMPFLLQLVDHASPIWPSPCIV